MCIRDSFKLKESPYIFVDSEDLLQECFKEIQAEKVLGIDLEFFHDPEEMYIGFVCLVQISSFKKDYIIDALRLRATLGKVLGPVFASSDIVKIFHGCDNDLKWLKNDFDVDVVNMFDTSRAYLTAEGEKFTVSLQNLALRTFNVMLDKGYQRSDWRLRPLPKQMLDYARADSSSLLYLYCDMLMSLDRKNSEGKHILVTTAARCNRVCWKVLSDITLKKLDLTLLQI
eukprot:TRINITY_DN9901_c0_g1_i1.p1 TRINITY_DN9901_c0_g1~~TRINITY_DN9901_c0_g1_i1.p1  ORF type:complete len:228 (-),score=33.96 TRINITY_DN9901_c0_g1_i1:187-870(-)